MGAAGRVAHAPSSLVVRRHGQSWSLTGRRLALSDLDALLRLHHRSLEGMPPSWVARDDEAFFCRHLGQDGMIGGLYDGARLVAFAVLGLPMSGAPNFGTDHALSPEQLDRVAHLDGAGVAPEWRGHGLQRVLSNWRIAVARALQREIVLSTVSPLNLPSLASQLGVGLSARGLKQRFSGWRLLMRCDLSRVMREPVRGDADVDCGRQVSAARSVSLDDVAALQQAFADGWIGVALDAPQRALRLARWQGPSSESVSPPASAR